MSKFKEKTSKIEKIPSETQLKFRRSAKLKKAVIKAGLAAQKQYEKEKRSLPQADLGRILKIFVKS